MSDKPGQLHVFMGCDDWQEVEEVTTPEAGRAYIEQHSLMGLYPATFAYIMDENDNVVETVIEDEDEPEANDE